MCNYNKDLPVMITQFICYFNCINITYFLCYYNTYFFAVYLADFYQMYNLCYTNTHDVTYKIEKKLG